MVAAPNNAYLLNYLTFDLVGSLLNDQIPTFLRPTPAFWEGYVNGSWRQVEFASNHPRFSSNGTLLLEQSTINLCTYPTALSHSSWVKGSSMLLQPDRIQGPNRNWKADRLVVSATTGNAAAQRLSKQITLNSNEFYVATICLRLADGRFGDNDYFEISGGIANSPQRVYLANVYNDRIGNYIPVSIPFKSSGNTPGNYDLQVRQTATMTLSVDRAASIDWAYCQLEPGVIPTSFVQQDYGSTMARAADFLQYPYSPIAGLSSFVMYANLNAWKGDGIIVEVGNFRLEILNAKLRATIGAITCSDPTNLPDNAQICVRLSKGLEKVRLYVNQTLVAEQTVPSFTATQAPLTIGGEGTRQIGCLYFFNSDLSDGGLLSIGSPIASDLLLLHQQDSLMAELPEGYGMVVLPAVRIPAGESIELKFPPIQDSRQDILAKAAGSGAIAQVDRITVQSAPAAGGRVSVQINEQQFIYQADGSPTTAKVAAGLTALINAAPKKEKVTASYSSGNTFTIAADVAGDSFYCVTSDELSRVTTIGNSAPVHTITVANASDYVSGLAYVFRDYIFVCELVITSINLGTNQISVRALPNSKFANITASRDVLIQPRWQLQLGRNVYFCHDLEDHPDIRVKRKTIDSFTLKNVGGVDRMATPYFKVAL